MSEQRPVALSIQPPGQTTGGQNPLQALDVIAQIQQRNIANQTNLRILQARQNLGEIWATSPPDQLYSNLSRSPDIAFFPEMATLARQSDLATTQINASRQNMTKDASDAWGKSLTGLYMDPYPTQERYNSLTQATADTMADPVAKANFLKHSVDIGTSLLTGLPSEEAMRNNPKLAQQANALVRQRILGQIAGTVGNWDAISSSILGGPQTVIEGRPFVRPYGAPGTLQQMPVGTPMVPGLSTAATPSITPGTTPSPTDANPAAISDGKPLWEGNLAGQSTDKPTSINPVTGQATFDPTVQEGMNKRMEQFRDAERGDTAKYRNAQNVVANTGYIRDAFNQLQQSGGFLQPGPGLPTRVQLIRSWNVIRGMLNLPGKDLPEEASFTDLQKQQTQLGFSSLSQFFGMGREAMMTVQAALNAVPGVENTFLGGQLVNRSIEAMAQREMDRFNFMEQWQSQNHGSLGGAESEFNRLHPADAMAQQVLSEFGLGRRGFTGANAAETERNIGTALSKGYLTSTEALNLRNGRPASYQGPQVPPGGAGAPIPGTPLSPATR